MTSPRAMRVLAWAAAWWGLVTGVLWLGGRLLGQSASLSGCALGALLIIVVGEIGDRVRRAWTAARRHH
ncbi:hypothetical protein [Streptomyces sp. NPDC090022]|uniref:hypothetical protein n=1 Tax=Streptomyces sp. NPDC090022 TaxID=3365920 RepID=UPI00382E7023